MEGRVAAGDTELAYVRIGSGTPAVAIPGGPGFGHAYLRAGFDLLADGHEIVYYDTRGSGDSPPGDRERISVAGSLADLDVLLDGLGLDLAALAGHSAAAYVAMVYASTRPARVRALVLCNPGPPLNPELREQFGAEMARRRPPEDAEEIERLEQSEEFGRRDVATLERYFRLRHGPFFATRESAQNAAYGFTQITAENVIESAGRLLRDFQEHDPVGSLARVRCPTLVVHGEHDPIPLESSRFIADQIPGAELTVIEGGSHYAFLDRPEQFAAAVEPFLARHA
jgi:proline iminopeptidase